MAACKGIKKDGTPCRSPIVLDNGYCRAHQDQASEEPVRWTRERLEAAIVAHGGPDGLDLAGTDLSNLDLSGMDLHGILLQGAVLQGVKLLKADLREAYLRDANLRGGELPDADLRGANLEVTDLQRVDLSEAKLQGARLALADLQEAGLEFARLQRARLRHVSLRGAYLRDTNLQGADLQGADLREVDLLDVEPGGLLGIKLYRAKLDHTLLKREQLGPAIGDEQAREYRQARDAYLALKQNFEDLGDYEAASWSYIKERQMEKACSAPWRARRFYGEGQLGDTSEHRLPAYHPWVWWFFARHTTKWLSDWSVEVLCGYGESIGRVLGWMAVLLFVSPLLFGLLGLLDWPHKNAETFHNLSVPRRYGYAYLQQFLYVLDAFTTADFAELQPASSFGRLCSGLIALVGIFLTGLLGFVVGNRIRRS
jgi:hypothetical protein